MKRKISLIGAILVGVGIGVACGPEIVGASDRNDVVLDEREFNEFFSSGDRGKKNYLYTQSEFTTANGVYCVVVQNGDKPEASIAMQCLEMGPS